MHKLAGQELARRYNQARSRNSGVRLYTCSICGSGVRHLTYHLRRQHDLAPGSEPYRAALGCLPSRGRPQRTVSAGGEGGKNLKKKQQGRVLVPRAILEWVDYESRGEGAAVDREGMKRSVRTILKILEENSLSLDDLIGFDTTVRAYEILYRGLCDRSYRYGSICVMLGALRKFTEWASSESRLKCSDRFRREHDYYTKLSRRRSALECVQRKSGEYTPTIDELAPLIRAEKHGHILAELLDTPEGVVERYGSDLVHGSIAWPLMKNCGVRTGVLVNMLACDVRAARRYEEGFVIKVGKHKTSDVYGPYQVAVRPVEHKYMINYLDNRAVVSDYVFCTREGKQSSYANVSRFMTRLFTLYGLEKLKAVTIRRFITTAVHKSGDEAAIEATAALLKHSVTTARRDYKSLTLDYDALRTSISLWRQWEKDIGAVATRAPPKGDTEVVLPGGLDDEEYV